MKLLFQYICKVKKVIAWALICSVCYAVIFALYGITMAAVWYPLLLCTLVSAGFFLYGFFQFCRKHQVLESLKGGKEGIGDALPVPEGILEEDYQDLVRREETLRRREKEHGENARQDMEDYYATWVHQIKAPIAVMRVLLQQDDTQENQELRAELFRIEQYVEMALCYVRLGADTSDLVIQEYSLDDIIRKAVRKFAGQFIRRKIRLVYQGTDETVLTDEKWLSFILEQLLSNAVKYTAPGGSITITVDEKKRMSVADTGIGIAPEDLPRIFEKGYTGYNGRLDKKSTGIGLYLCRTAADLLGHKLSAESVLEEGSRFTVDLDSYPFQAE